ncbi:Rho GTPase activation protein [Absidia repens]|uniref:Rho GTPase activation protein n=1 Tax=Absidia repens TaxID=90262 RepID=A0A1X2IM02_9FUNG|nr:Rho GTPase activation protein [Absidia repens]
MGTISTEDMSISSNSNSNTTQTSGLTAPQKTLIKAWWKKVIATVKVDNKLSLSADKTVFGLPLLHSIQYAHTTISYRDEITNTPCMAVIPTIIAKCGSYLKEKGLQIEGIFRLSGNSKRIGHLQSLFDTSDTQYGVYLNWDNYNIHDVANVMRRFLNYLPEPVIPLNYYQLFKATMETEFVSADVKTQAFQSLIDKMPLAHQFLLLYLLDLLSIFTLTSHLTRMDISCLASVFAPGILSHPDDALNPSSYKQSQPVLEFLIKHQHKFRMPSSGIPFVKSECMLRPPLQVHTIQHPLSTLTPSSLPYTGNDTFNNSIHPLCSNTAAPSPPSLFATKSTPVLSSPSAPPYPFQDTMFPTTTLSSTAPSPSSSSSTDIRRKKTLTGKTSASMSTSTSTSTSTSMSTPSFYLPNTNSDPRVAWLERSTRTSILRRERQQPNQKSSVPRWKSIRTVSTMERDGLNTPIFTQ